MDLINILLPDGTKKEFPVGVTGHDIAESIGPGLLRASIAIKVDGELKDLQYKILNNSSIEILTKRDEEAHHILLHSTAHLLAQSVKEIFPEAKIAIGPALKDTFYYDIDIDEVINTDVLLEIEKKMLEISKRAYPVFKEELSLDNAIKLFKDLKEDYKVEIVSEIESDDKISAYKQGKFIDLCRGPHVPNTKNIKFFKLLSTAGAYWRGDDSNKMLQRIYGTSWFSKEDLKQFLIRLEEAKKRDHRKIGRELEIYSFDEEVGPGLPLWLPNGTVLIDELEAFAKETENRAGYMRVKTPHLTKGVLYEKSGHLEHYKDSMYPAMSIDETDYYVKPMNCPHHHKIYASSPRSYRDLPLRLAEYGTCYRYEKSGQLFGLMRVRSLQMNDAHIYCTKDQFKQEFLSVCKMYLKYFNIFGIKKYSMRLSLHDKEGLGKKYVNEPELWLETEDWVREALNQGGIDFVEVPGEAAFYGPKIDVQVWSAIGKEFTLATNQVDFAVPEKFNLEYVDEYGTSQTPLCIHRAPLGTHERFIGFLIEHFGGNFPLWLAPVQVTVLPVSDKNLDYASDITQQLRQNGFRAKLNDKADKIGAKIRQAELEKINIMLIVGEKEASNNTVSLRRRFEGDTGAYSLDTLINELNDEIKHRRLSHSEKAEAATE